MTIAHLPRVVVAFIPCLSLGTALQAQEQGTHRAGLSPSLTAKAQKSIDLGLEFLRSSRTEEGGWTAAYGPAVTAIVAQAFARDKAHGPRHPVVRRAVATMLKFEQPDGGIYERQRNLANYQTSVVLMLLAALDDPAHKPRIAKAQDYLRRLQFDAGESIATDNPWYGGAGYNEAKRPDLSNTQMMLEALHQSGLPEEDPVYQRALTFVTRCQLYGATNDQPFADGEQDGGFIYSPNAGGESKAADEVRDGPPKLRSYGSMTYAGFKSLLYAGLSRDDPRVTACLKWIRNHWTLDHNPNMPGTRSKQGLYYYYHVFARALHAWGKPTITDTTGKTHNWREELCKKLISLQRPDGSWFNDQDRWLEGDPSYITGLTILSLQTALNTAQE